MKDETATCSACSSLWEMDIIMLKAETADSTQLEALRTVEWEKKLIERAETLPANLRDLTKRAFAIHRLYSLNNIRSEEHQKIVAESAAAFRELAEMPSSGTPAGFHGMVSDMRPLCRTGLADVRAVAVSGRVCA